MLRLGIYLGLVVLAALSLYCFLTPAQDQDKAKPKRRFSFRRNPIKEDWVQVYETASWEEARQIQDCLRDEGFECILYEQGKKDIHGNPLRGIGIAVPKTSAGFAQKIISRIPV